MDNSVATQSAPKPKRLKPKQRETIVNWITPKSDTYGNLYKSAVKAGFAKTYALNLTHLRPSWLSETIEATQLEPIHIKQGIQQIATNPDINSRSPADTNLKAYELLARYSGMDSDKQVNITVVQPILGGVSERTNPKVVDSTTKPVE